MYIKVGVYELNTSEEFKTEEEAVARFLEAFPDANTEKVKAKVKPYFTKKDVKVSEPIAKESEDSGKQNAKVDSASISEKSSGGNK